MICEDCEGNGYVYSGPSCDSPASECCGGCYELLDCETCNGKGEIDEDGY